MYRVASPRARCIYLIGLEQNIQTKTVLVCLPCLATLKQLDVCTGYTQSMHQLYGNKTMCSSPPPFGYLRNTYYTVGVYVSQSSLQYDVWPYTVGIYIYDVWLTQQGRWFQVGLHSGYIYIRRMPHPTGTSVPGRLNWTWYAYALSGQVKWFSFYELIYFCRAATATASAA